MQGDTLRTSYDLLLSGLIRKIQYQKIWCGLENNDGVGVKG